MGAPVRFEALVRDGGIDEARHEVTALVKGTHTDRHRTLFIPEAFARSLPIFLKTNPLFLWQHRQRGEPEDALGSVVDGRITPDGPVVTFCYAVEENPKAAQVWKLVAARVIRGYSIAGWILQQVDNRSPREEVDALPEYARNALLASECDAVITDIELAEISQVLIGSDRDAFIKAAAEGLMSPELALRMLAEAQEVKETMTMRDSQTAATEATASPSMTRTPADSSFARLLDGLKSLCERVAALDGTLLERQCVPIMVLEGKFMTLAEACYMAKYRDCTDEDLVRTRDGILAQVASLPAEINAAFTDMMKEPPESGDHPIEESAPASPSPAERSDDEDFDAALRDAFGRLT